MTATEYVSVEKLADKESYMGVCDDINLGVSLIFSAIEYERLYGILHGS